MKDPRPPLPAGVQRLCDPYGAREDERLAYVSETIAQVPRLMEILTAIRDLDLADGWLVSGGLYQTLWNILTDRPLDHGIKDYDIIYFDGADLSYEAEDRVIKTVNAALPGLASLLEVRNQARVHLWSEKRFGRPARPLHCSMDSLTTYAARTHAIAARLDPGGKVFIHAPFGLANILAMRIVPNGTYTNRDTYEEKGARMKGCWPELVIEPWKTTPET